jgi:hypothetical protein
MRLFAGPPGAADAVGMYFFVPLAGFVFGAAVGRWWTIAAAAPLGVYILAANDLEGSLGTWVALTLSGLLGCAIGAGVALRRLHGRSRLGGLGGTSLVLGVLCSFRGKDAGSADSHSYRCD